MKKLFICSSIVALLAGIAIGINGANPVELEANGLPTPTAGDLQTALTDASTKSYVKYTNITSYNGVSAFPWAEHNPIHTNYTSQGLYMNERGSGYYTYQNAIWHIKKDGSNETRNLSMSEYHTYDAYYKTLGSFASDYVSGNLESDTTDTSGLTYKNKAGYTTSTAEIIKMIYFVAPLVTVNETGSAFTNYVSTFKIKVDGSSYVLDSISLSVDITVNSTTSHLESSATFSGIGSTALGYDIPA